MPRLPDLLRKNLRTIAWIIGTVAVLVLYLSCCKSLWKYNPLFDADSPKNYDQTFYIHTANSFVLGEHVLMPRSRMPLYPWLLHFLADPKKDDVDVLTPMIRFNVGLSVLCLGAIFFMLRGPLGKWLAVLTTLVTAFRVFVFKAVLVQPEILFYTLYFALFLLLMRYLKKPGWRLAVGTGLLAGVAHLTKGSALPMAGIFFMLAFVREFLGWRSAGGKKQLSEMAVLLRPVAFVAAFLCVTGMWLRNSLQEYGSAFYDPNTRYYFWAESPREMMAMQHLGLANWKPRFEKSDIDDEIVREFFPKWAPDAALRAEIEAGARERGQVLLEGKYDILPGFTNWRATHTWRDAVQRVWSGLFSDDSDDAKKHHQTDADRRKLLLYMPSVITGDALIGHNRDHPNGYWDFLRFVFGAAFISLSCACFFSWRAVRDVLAANWLPLTFAIAVITLTGLSYAWWAQISNRNRYFLTLWLPLVASFGMIVRHACAHVPLQLKIVWHRRSIILGAFTIFLSTCTVVTLLDLNDPLNRGNLPNPHDLFRQIVQ